MCRNCTCEDFHEDEFDLDEPTLEVGVDPDWWNKHIAAGNHDGLCEECGVPMSPYDLIMTDTSIVCSQECAEGHYDVMSEEELRHAERTQMGG